MDYTKLCFKAGIEIHQQLDTGKLFCRCPSIVHDKNPDIHFERKLYARAGEHGTIDTAALAEMKKARGFLYEGCSTSACLVELDEEPPLPINEEALRVVLHVAQLVHAHIIEDIQIMRKTVIDGSNVSGFQRTALVAVNRYIETSKGKISIPGINIEEESARKIEGTDTHLKYRLDRLGIPLIEISTGPELQDPEHVKEAAEKLGMILRSTGKMKRGIGTIRQDVNVSIKNGARTEIKGFKDLRSIPKVVEYEIERQLQLINDGRKIAEEVRKAEPDFSTSYLRPMSTSARMYPETDLQTYRITSQLLEGAEDIEMIEDVATNFIEKYGLDKDIAMKIAKSEQKYFFRKLCEKYKNIKSSFIADTLLSSAKQIKQKYNIEINPSQEDYEALFSALDNEKIAKESVLDILKEGKAVKEIIDKFKLISDKELEKELHKIISENKNVPPQALIGKAMVALRGKAAGQKIVEMLKKLTS